MNALKKFILKILDRAGYSLVHTRVLAKERANETFLEKDSVLRIDVRPLAPIGDESGAFENLDASEEWLNDLHGSKYFRSLHEYFRDYPRYSLMSANCRAIMYMLVRARKPHAVAEVGTQFAGTTEVIARALWENGWGTVHTCDPFGVKRCPPIIDQWPISLKSHTRFYPLNSMDFFLELQRTHTSLDIALVDGNHDFEFALFDLQMAARLLRPGGMVVMDNAEQTGPFFAARQFLSANPGWIELGRAISAFDPKKAFDGRRASVPQTTFILLKAPTRILVQETPRSWGQCPIADSRVYGLTIYLGAQRTLGELQYHVILRAFRIDSQEIEEYKFTGDTPINLNGTSTTLEVRFPEPLISRLQESKGGCNHTLEIEFSWNWETGFGPLALAKLPQPIVSS